MMSSDSDDLSVDEKSFDWNKYLSVRNAEAVPKDFFHHICESEMNGIKLGSVLEIENEYGTGYWFAIVCLSEGAYINLHYFYDDNDKHNFWLKVNSSRLHSLNWGSENSKKLIPPHPERFSRLIPEYIKEKVQNCEHAVSNTVLQMKGAPIHNIFKCDMFVEVQDKEYPYRVWISKVLKNVGGRLLLQIQGVKSPKKKSFWLFYLNESVFPLGWAEEKGLPWRVMNLDANLENSIDYTVLLNVLKRKIPEQHGYTVGEMLEVINPYSLMEFYVATIVKIYDNYYFKVEVNNEIDVEKRMSFVATKENPYLFNAGWASKHKFLLKPPSDWKKPNKFSWSKYISMKNSKLASVDIMCRKNSNSVQIGMKLEAVDPLNTDSIRVATVKGFADHWMFLSFDSISCCQESLHVRSVYSDEVFPVGWCNKHKYSISVPKLPYRETRYSGSSEYLRIPKSKQLAGIYCSALCDIFGMCEFFMTTEDTKCPHSCNAKKDKTEKELNQSNKPLVAKCNNYLTNIISLDAHITGLNQSNTALESSLVAEIISKKNLLKRMDNMDIFSNTKSEVKTIEEKLFVVLENWKTTFENYYRQNPRFKKYKIDIGQFEHIKITSNPKYWSSLDVYKYLTNDVFCKDIAKKLFDEEFDGKAFMLLNEEQLLKRLWCSINLAIRIMCHVVEAKFICLTKYCNVADS